MYNSVEPYSLALFVNVLGMSSEEAMDIINAAKKDLLNPKMHMYMPAYVHYIMKSLLYSRLPVIQIANFTTTKN